MANYFADEEGHNASVDDIKKSLELNPKHPYALAKLADYYLSNGDFVKAEQFAFRSLQNNPTYGLPAAILIDVADQKKDTKLLNQAIETTTKLWPSHSRAHVNLANYWVKKGNIKKVLPEWNILLSQDHKLKKQLFPILFELSQTPEGLKLLAPYAQKPSTWWNSFFLYLTRQKDNISSLQWLYNMRIKSKEPLTSTERDYYVQRLMQEKKWMPAYFAWLSGLEDKDKQYLKTKLFDGGFDGSRHNTGFDWYFSSNNIVTIKQEITRGMSGRSALHASFASYKRIYFQHVYQTLLLVPGTYTVKFRSRIDRLKNNKGLTWRVRCLGDTNTILGESRHFLGLEPWKDSKFSIHVPDNTNCKAQILRLEAVSKYPHNHVFSGDIWFDDIEIKNNDSEISTELKQSKPHGNDVSEISNE